MSDVTFPHIGTRRAVQGASGNALIISLISVTVGRARDGKGPRGMVSQLPRTQHVFWKPSVAHGVPPGAGLLGEEHGCLPHGAPRSAR